MKYFWIVMACINATAAVTGLGVAVVADDYQAGRFGSHMLLLTGICLFMLAIRLRREREAKAATRAVLGEETED